MVSKDEKYQNAMKNSDEQSARLESERALQQVIFAIMADNMELFKQFQDNPSFKVPAGTGATSESESSNLIDMDSRASLR